MKRFNVFPLFLALLLASALVPSAVFGAAPSISSVLSEKVTPTYAVSSVNMTPAATPIDIAALWGSATKTVRLRRVAISGVATSAGTMDFSLVKRTALDTGGTYSNSSPSMFRSDTGNATATASLAFYSANPTNQGATQSIFRTRKLNFGVGGAAGLVEFTWPQNQFVAPVLHGTTEGITIYGNAEPVPSGGNISVEIEWEEY